MSVRRHLNLRSLWSVTLPPLGLSESLRFNHYDKCPRCSRVRAIRSSKSTIGILAIVELQFLKYNFAIPRLFLLHEYAYFSPVFLLHVITVPHRCTSTVKPQYIMCCWGRGGRLLPECRTLTVFHIVSVGVLTLRILVRKLFYEPGFFFT